MLALDNQRAKLIEMRELILNRMEKANIAVFPNEVGAFILDKTQLNLDEYIGTELVKLVDDELTKLSAQIAAMDKVPVEPPRQNVIELTDAEIQSGMDRVWYAELLILQLPAYHDGRNTWLKLYGKSPPDADTPTTPNSFPPAPIETKTELPPFKDGAA